jgi:peptide/nickel transport system permease protein
VTSITVLNGEPLSELETKGRANARPYVLYALRRLVQAVVVVILAYVVTFVLITVLGGNPIATQLSNPQAGLDPAQVKRVEAYYGVGKPVIEQLWLGISRFFQGQLGVSLQYHQPVSNLISTALPYTLKLASLALLVSLLMSALIAFGTQYLPFAPVRSALRSVPSLFLSVPNFIIGLLLIQAFSFQLHAFDILSPNNFLGTLLAAIALAIPISAPLAEVLIANLDHESQQEYALVARSRGLSEGRLLLRHLVKPSLLPAVTMAALIAGELMGGAVITEEVFGRTGIGSVMYSAVQTRDAPVLQAVVSLAAVVFVLVNLIADLLGPLLDPRVQLVRTRRTAAGSRTAAAS